MNAKDFKSLCVFGASVVSGNVDPSTTDGLNPAALLYALGGLESSFGRNVVPRFEPAFGRGGRYADRSLLKKHGDAAAMSYGPWQIMYSNAFRVMPIAPSPFSLQGNVVAATVATALFLAQQWKRFDFSTIEAALDTWNTGNPRDSIKPSSRYMERGARYYWDAVREQGGAEVTNEAQNRD